jgi:hypothetical protein
MSNSNSNINNTNSLSPFVGRDSATAKFRRFSGKIIRIAGVILLILAGGSFSCREKNDVKQNDIVGTWIKKTTYSDVTGDTIVFTNDLRVEDYFKYEIDKDCKIGYKLKVDTVFFSVVGSSNNVEQGFKYSINGNKLTIFGFTYPFFLISIEREDVTFIRSQTN